MIALFSVRGTRASATWVMSWKHPSAPMRAAAAAAAIARPGADPAGASRLLDRSLRILDRWRSPRDRDPSLWQSGNANGPTQGVQVGAADWRSAERGMKRAPPAWSCHGALDAGAAGAGRWCLLGDRPRGKLGRLGVAAGGDVEACLAGSWVAISSAGLLGCFRRSAV